MLYAAILSNAYSGCRQGRNEEEICKNQQMNNHPKISAPIEMIILNLSFLLDRTNDQSYGSASHDEGWYKMMRKSSVQCYRLNL
jgi:hypothetical protein